MSKILHLDTSPRKEASASRKISAAIVAQLSGSEPTEVTYRDLSVGLPVLTEELIEAIYMPEEHRNEKHRKLLSLSDTLVQELRDHQVIVIGMPMHNYNIPATLKLWADLVARVGETFIFTEQGSVGLLENKKIYFAVTTGGVPIGSPLDHLSPFLKTYFESIGIIDQTFINADGLMQAGDEKMQSVEKEIALLESV